MSRQPMLRLRLVARLTVGLLGVATALLLAPPAAAQPEVEANNAITAAWQAGGGDTGPLGPKTGDVYPAGAGFAQNFAAGKMYFTPATGAHFMQGAILEKYEALGGAADSDLGFPTIDEGPGRAPESRNSTFSASDNPVIFWTPGTGARVVRGPINAAWDRLGGSSGVLGVPAEDEAYNGAVVSQKFTGGELSYDSRAKTFTTVPPDLAGQLGDLVIPDDPVAAINAARRAAGGVLGPLGAPDGEPYKIGSDGMGQDFVNGKIFYSPQTGANVVTGQVLEKYESVGGPDGDLGFPITSEQNGGLTPTSRISAFAADDKPVIFWTPDHGAVIVRGAMNAAWSKLGGATGELGAPVADQTQNGAVITQRFSNGAISWDTGTQKFTTEPAGLGPQLVGLEVPGAEVPQAPPPTSQPSENSESSGLKWTWWWLLAIIPLLLLAGLIGFTVVRNRGRRRDEDLFGGPGLGVGPGYDPGLSGAGVRTGDEGREHELFGDRYAREGLGPLGSAAPVSGEEHRSDVQGFWGSQPADDRDEDEAADGSGVAQENPDAVDTAPTRVLTPEAEHLSHDVIEDDRGETRDDVPEQTESDADREPFIVAVGEPTTSPIDEPFTPVTQTPPRDPMVDTGRHARIDVDEPLPLGTALHMPFDDPGEIPEGYPIKADTTSGLYWTPDCADYHDAPVEIWFATEEIARTNGFVRGE